MTLADLGAQVIKVEPPTGDPLREYDAHVFEGVNHNKTTLRLDLKSAADLARLRDQVGKSDVFIEGMRPGVAARLGIDYQLLRAIRPDLVYCSISGFGQHGDLAGAAGHDINYQSLSGALSLPGQVGEPPRRSGLPVGDLAAAMYASVGVLAALRHRDRTGEGSYLDLAIRDALVGWLPSRVGDNWTRETAPDQHLEVTNDIYQGSDAARFAIAAIEDKFWSALRDTIAPLDVSISNEEFGDRTARRRNGKRLQEILTAAFSTRTGAEWLRDLRAAGVPVSPVFGPRDVASDPALLERGIIEVDGESCFARLPIVRNGKSWSVPFRRVAEMG